ncbi:MAG: FAD-binding oxidoreductase, partial [Achromobacter mucicolens]
MTLLSDLQALLGDSHVLTGADADSYVLDWRRRYRGAALAVIRPGSTADVAAAIKLCAQHGVPVVPQGGNTGLCGGATPDDSGTAIVLSTARLTAVRALDTDNDTI